MNRHAEPSAIIELMHLQVIQHIMSSAYNAIPEKKNSILNQVDALQTCGSAFTDGDHDDHPYDV